jgi:uncharacterized protein
MDRNKGAGEVGAMNDPVDSGGPQPSVPSPCISVCTMNAQTGLCEGCQRTLEEIAEWSTASEEWKRAVWEEILRRRL